MFFLIDGYNLALSGGLARTLNGPGNAERARNSLLGWLANRLTAVERSRTTIVFDAKPGSIEQKEVAVNEMRVLFAVDYPDADSMMEELIDKNSAPKNLTVVSGDQRIQIAARRRRALAIPSQIFHAQMERRSRQLRISTNSEEKLPVDDPNKLVSEFDTAEIQQLIEEEKSDYP